MVKAGNLWLYYKVKKTGSIIVRMGACKGNEDKPVGQPKLKDYHHLIVLVHLND